MLYSPSPSYCLVGIGVLAAGILYWAVWRIVLPLVFGYELYPTKEVLSDGTVVTVVCLISQVFARN